MSEQSPIYVGNTPYTCVVTLLLPATTACNNSRVGADVDKKIVLH